MGTRHQVDAGRYHRSGMDQGADGRWTLHRVWQPHVKRQLGRFGRAGDEEQQANYSGSRAWSRLVEGSEVAVAVGIEIQRAIVLENEENGDHQAKVADDVDDQ